MTAPILPPPGSEACRCGSQAVLLDVLARRSCLACALAVVGRVRRVETHHVDTRPEVPPAGEVCS